MPPRLPPWIKIRLRVSENTRVVNDTLKACALHTVCESALCPNRQECFARKTATFMILGDVCTRNCGFCAVRHGVPEAPDNNEPLHVAEASAELGMKHVVITSVTRDDLPDGGAGHFAETVNMVKKHCNATVEVLVPDFKGREEDIRTVLDSGIDVFNHNVETVRSLQLKIRPDAAYERSLGVLKTVSGLRPELHVKSGLMLGLGETETEVLKTLNDLLEAGCRLLTIGQYLAPSSKHEPVHDFIHPEKFEFYRVKALGMGFKAVASAPLVRSSYNALAMLREARDTAN